MNVDYVADADVDSALDQALRDLLCVCFTKPHDAVFRDRRYFKEPPRHRWIVRGEGTALVAHAAVHEKEVECDGEVIPIGGIAEVCVHPDFRKRGLVREMLTEIHPWLTARNFPFAVLFGEAAVYESSGYRKIGNFHVKSETGDEWEPTTHALAHFLQNRPWPEGKTRLIGLRF